MPELPEVEVVCRGLAPLLTGHIITKTRYSHFQLRLPSPLNKSTELLAGSPVKSVGRRAKFIVIHFANEAALIIHLGMTGRLGLFPVDTPPQKHDHCFWLLDNGLEMRYNDIRRFGSIQITVSNKETNRLFKDLGPDPFSQSFTAEYMFTKARHRKVCVKSFLMDNHVVPGIGNIYANETLHAAAVHPETTASELTIDKWRDIVRQSKRILKDAIENGGTTIANYVNSSGERGWFQVKLLVYGRNGEACRKCGEEIQRSIVGGRATFFCPACQIKNPHLIPSKRKRNR